MPNSTWQLMSALTHNLVRDFQVVTGHGDAAQERSEADVPLAVPVASHVPVHDADRAGSDLPDRTGGRSFGSSASKPTRRKIQQVEQRLAA